MSGASGGIDKTLKKTQVNTKWNPLSQKGGWNINPLENNSIIGGPNAKRFLDLRLDPDTSGGIRSVAQNRQRKQDEAARAQKALEDKAAADLIFKAAYPTVPAWQTTEAVPRVEGGYNPAMGQGEINPALLELLQKQFGAALGGPV
jgi:hypothetical protein